MNIRLFDERDAALLARIPYDAGAAPDFDPSRHCLTWADEYSPDLSASGHEILYDLWVARNHIHTGLPFSSRPLGGDYYEAFWQVVTQADIQWNGFNRLELTGEQRTILEQSATLYETDDGPL